MMAATVFIVPRRSSFKITKLSLETVEFDGIRETMPVETDVKVITGPATIRIVEFDKIGDAPACKACYMPLLEGSHFCHECGVKCED